MIAAGGLSLDDLFARVRLRVSEVTNGGEVPWYASQIEGPFFITERSADAPPPPNVIPLADLRSKPMRSYSGAEDAYAAALALDTMEGYEQFLALYPSGPYSRRVAAMLAARREEIIWRRCVFNNTPPAYWSYLRRYPNGPHVWDARRRLAMIGAPPDPAPNFAFFDFGVPPPPPDEMGFVDQPVVMFWGPGYAPPPRPPALFLPPRSREFSVLPPPPPSRERFALPTPGVAVVPVFVKPPRTVAIPPAPPGRPPGRVPVALPGAVQASPTVRAHRTHPAQGLERLAHLPSRPGQITRKHTRDLHLDPDGGREACSVAAASHGTGTRHDQAGDSPQHRHRRRLRSSLRSCRHTPQVRRPQRSSRRLPLRPIPPLRHLRRPSLRRRHPTLPLRRRIPRHRHARPAKPSPTSTGIRPANKIRASMIARGVGFQMFSAGPCGPVVCFLAFEKCLKSRERTRPWRNLNSSPSTKTTSGSFQPTCKTLWSRSPIFSGSRASIGL
jgi:hypothetical protein